MVGNGKDWIRNARWAIALNVLFLAAPLGAFAGSAPEASIPFANHGGIRDWRADGSRGMWIEAASNQWFYASFSSQCTTLPAAIGLKFVPEPSGALSRWSSIRLEHNERCFFRTLQPSDAPPKKLEPAKPAISPGPPDKRMPGSISPAVSTAMPADLPMALNLTSAAIQELMLSAPLQVMVDDDRALENFGDHQPPIT
jgi:hypothetical protein